MKFRLMICAMAASTALFATDVTSDTYGVLSVTNAAATTVVGVPWRNVGGGEMSNVTLSNLVSTTGLATDDIIYLYEGTTWYGYKLSGTGVWEPYTTVSGTTTVSQPGSADGKTLARGTGLIIERASAANPIFLCGRYDSSTPSATSVSSGSKALVANPTTTIKYVTVGAVGDEIRVVKDGGAMDIFERRSDGWYGTELVTVGGFSVKKKVKLASGVPLDPGKGVWYVNNGSDAVSVSWGE